MKGKGDDNDSSNGEYQWRDGNCKINQLQLLELKRTDTQMKN